MIKRQRLPKLLNITFDITNECPLKCLHCSTSSRASSGQRLPFPIFQRLLREATNVGCETVILSGGDPLVIQDLPLYVREAKLRGLTVCVYSCGIVTTNGHVVTVGHSAIHELSRSGLDRVMFGVYSAREKIHDKITKSAGSLNRTLEAAQRFREAGIPTEFQFVPMKPNWSDLPSLVKLAKTLGASMVNVLRFVPQGRGRVNAGSLLMSSSEYLHFQEMLGKLLSDGDSSMIRIGAPFNPFRGVTQAHCTAGVSRLYVAPSGEIFPCEAFKCALAFKITSNLHMGIDDAWAESTILKDLRRQVASKPGDRNWLGCPAQAFWATGSICPDDDPLVDILRTSHSPCIR